MLEKEWTQAQGMKAEVMEAEERRSDWKSRLLCNNRGVKVCGVTATQGASSEIFDHRLCKDNCIG